MASLEAIFTHMVLPHSVPGRQDTDLESIAHNLTKRLIGACDILVQLCSDEVYARALVDLRNSLATSSDISLGRLDVKVTKTKFSQLHPGESLILHIESQNAAVIVRNVDKGDEKAVIFEAFEISPLSENVLATEIALHRCFPDRAAEIPLEIFRDDGFQDALVSFLEQASLESFEHFAAHTRKAKIGVSEARDTTNPALITHMLMSLLEALGKPADTTNLHKRVRDDVSLQDAELPWRRIPSWLVARVFAQRQLESILGQDVGRICYKILMCTAFGELLKECSGRLSPEMTITLRGKLCRRMAKLELERKRSKPSSSAIYDSLFTPLANRLKIIITNVTDAVGQAWEAWKTHTKKAIIKLPRHADDSDLILNLTNSRQHLQQILQTRLAPVKNLQISGPQTNHLSSKAQSFARRFADLAQLETSITQRARYQSDTAVDFEAECSKVAEDMEKYFTSVGDAYESDEQQMSIFILNLFDMWVEMDSLALNACPLLREYHPTFTPELLDVLQLPEKPDMTRLEKIQGYLKGRCNGSKHGNINIFSQAGKKTFPKRWISQNAELQQLGNKIQHASDADREARKAEWAKASKDYEYQTQKLSEYTCTCSWNRDGSRNVNGCTRCWHWRCRNRIKADIHEDYLSEDSIQRSAVVHELGMPSYLRAYRDATWRIIRDLGLPGTSEEPKKAALRLQDQKQLQGYFESMPSRVSMASKKKSFLQTHYKSIKMKVDVEKVLLPQAAQFLLYDVESQTWIDDCLQSLTFEHLCGIRVPKPLRKSNAQINSTSYDIIASQPACPSGISIHEFLAFQGLLSGNNRRWPNILVQLNASNLNFSSEDTMHLVSQLATQAGPWNEETKLRDIHAIFHEQHFSRRLAEQIENRLSSIRPSWRETYCMETLISLTLRVLSLSSGEENERALGLLKMARAITLRWISQLRNEVQSATDAAEADNIAMYAFQAALLCRRTFTIYLESRDVSMSAEDLASFIPASVALQENLIQDIDGLSSTVKSMYMRDLKLVTRLRSLIRQSLQTRPECLRISLSQLLSANSEESTTSLSPWEFLDSHNLQWIAAQLYTNHNHFSSSQIVHYNFIEGHLLIDGKPLGRLPHNLRTSADVQELFGDQHLLTYPSGLFGMTHRLANSIDGNQIHFGLRNEEVVIRTLNRGSILEYIPGRVFRGFKDIDLPSGLIDNCTHWLNISYERLEIRRKPKTWKTRSRDWVLDIQQHRASRGNVSLVEPNSILGKRVAALFDGFELPDKLTIYQPATGPFYVELRHLELSFFVNHRGLLQSRELNAEIDPDQDAGTFYGFQSMLVVRDIHDHGRRSVIFPLGAFSWKRRGMHVAVRASSSNVYGKFEIDRVLGRLTCPPEPRLVYSMALCHAVTSFALPDILTAKTGLEEAAYILKSGSAQPWSPLSDIAIEILKTIAALSPQREFYPKDQRRLQVVTWDPLLTFSIQHDCYEPMVQDILTKSSKLVAFTDSGKLPERYEQSFLRKRGNFQRFLYERPLFSSTLKATDKSYSLSNRPSMSLQAETASRVTQMLRSGTFGAGAGRDLKRIIESWGDVEGFQEPPQTSPMYLNDLLQRTLKQQWGSLIEFCRSTDVSHPYEAIFRLSLLCFSPEPEIDAIKCLVAVACLDELKTLQPPLHSWFSKFKYLQKPSSKVLQQLIKPAFNEFKPTKKTSKAQQEAARSTYHLDCEAEGERFARFILQQWPDPEPCVEDFESPTLDTESALECILPEWTHLYRNFQLSGYICRVQSVIERYKHASEEYDQPKFVTSKVLAPASTAQKFMIPSLSTIKADLGSSPVAASKVYSVDVRDNASAISKSSPAMPQLKTATEDMTTKELSQLEQIFGQFSGSNDAHRRQYGRYLQDSLAALRCAKRTNRTGQLLPERAITLKDLDSASQAATTQLKRIQTAFTKNHVGSEWLMLGDVWPSMAPMTVLQLLRSTSDYNFDMSMRESIVLYGSLITGLQRLKRIYSSQLKHDERATLLEWQNLGHKNWNPIDFPDWLLFEIDSNLLIREEQVDVCHAIISPKTGSNSVLQMNMGKGKTSCIVPMAMACLANKKQLARLVVPKALLLQSAQVIQSRLGGLVNREVIHIPFSRRTPTTPEMLQLHRELHHDIFRSGGLILTTPEHLLSYKLSGLQMLADSNLVAAREMIKFQSRLNNVCRDVLDESDFSLAVKTQLIYPSGDRIPIDGHPHRWEVTQKLLSLIDGHLPNLQREFPDSLEVVRRPSEYPSLFFLRPDVEDALKDSLVDDVCSGRVFQLGSAARTSTEVCSLIRHLLLRPVIKDEDIEALSKYFDDKDTISKKLILVRGLLQNNIILLCLKKRWNVQYGLHPDRPPVAVPFEAKGVPSEQAEFGHPDVAICLTCLSFYYSGLTLTHFRESLQHLSKSFDPAAEFDKWIHLTNDLPETLRHWNMVNLEDQGQVEELWRNLRLNVIVLDYHLNHFVFPTHARQFSVKLQASSWDIPLFSKSVGIGKHKPLSTGFSGTNDNRTMLPMTIQQDDLPSLQHTNAEVLSYLLCDRNRGYQVASSHGKRATEEELIISIADMGIRILIDAGAYILGMDNRSLVKLWLEKDTQAKAAVFFGKDNRAWVLYRGVKGDVPLVATPFLHNLDECLVYLDEAHTRGVDLKLPLRARGALTLALNQTKDHTVQAAMRLRHLGTTQSIVFFAPTEVHQSIKDICKPGPYEAINSYHVITWLLEQTCRGNEQLQSLYLAQGFDFCRRTDAQWEISDAANDKAQRSSLLKVLQLEERKTLEQLYGTYQEQTGGGSTISNSTLRRFMKTLNDENQSLKAIHLRHSQALEEVEQEQEVFLQVEEIRTLKKPTKYQGLRFPGLHPTIIHFAETGILKDKSGYQHAFSSIAHTNVGLKYGVHATGSRLFVSAEFPRTVANNAKGSIPMDDFLRPVEWILWHPPSQTALVVIPEEAELLIPQIRNLGHQARVHLVAYAAPVMRDMLLFNDLTYYALPELPPNHTVPEWLSFELGIFAGRLYCDFEEFNNLTKYVQYTAGAKSATDSSSVGRRFTTNLVGFLNEWLPLRRKTQDISHTPMGYVCQGRHLDRSHAFFRTRDVDYNRPATEICAGEALSDGEDASSVYGNGVHVNGTN